MRYSDITEADLATLAHLLPRRAADLVRVVGAADAAALLNALPGVVFVVPKRAAVRDGSFAAHRGAARRWKTLCSVVSAGAAEAIAGYYGGNALEVPTCHQLRVEKRNRWLRERFDALTSTRQAAPGVRAMSRTQAVYELGLELVERWGEAMSAQGIENALDSTGPAAASRRTGPASAQTELFS